MFPKEVNAVVLVMPLRVSLAHKALLQFCTDLLQLHLLQVLSKLGFTVKVV